MPDEPSEKKPQPLRAIERQSQWAVHHDHSRPQSEGATPLFVEEEGTGKIEGDELKALRGRRPTDLRLERLEEKSDESHAKLGELDGKVDKLGLEVADMRGQFKVIPRLVDAMENATKALQQRDHVKFTATVDVEKAKEMSRVETDTADKLLETAKKKAKLDWITKLIAIISTIGGVIATAVAAGRC